MNTPHFTSREQVFDFLDDYASQRKEEIDRRQLGKDQGLIKSYQIETLPGNDNLMVDVPAVLRGTGWKVTPIEDAAFYRVRDDEGELSFAGNIEADDEVIDLNDRTAPELTDWDLDGDLDMVVGNADGVITLFINEGSAEEYDFSSMASSELIRLALKGSAV